MRKALEVFKQESKNGSKETITVIQETDSGNLDYDGSMREKIGFQVYFEDSSLTGLPLGQNLEIVIKDNAHVFCLSNWVIGSVIYYDGKEQKTCL